jgi:hypothetical protein
MAAGGGDPPGVMHSDDMIFLLPLRPRGAAEGESTWRAGDPLHQLRQLLPAQSFQAAPVRGSHLVFEFKTAAPD